MNSVKEEVMLCVNWLLKDSGWFWRSLYEGALVTQKICPRKAEIVGECPARISCHGIAYWEICISSSFTHWLFINSLHLDFSVIFLNDISDKSFIIAILFIKVFLLNHMAGY